MKCGEQLDQGADHMNEITIRQAQTEDILVVESILFDAVNWLNEIGQPLWGADEVSWDALSRNYKIENFYLAYSGGNPSGCMALVDHDPFFWPDVNKGESLFMHKLAVTKSARKSGVADALIEYFKKQGTERGIKTLRLDTHALRPKLRAFYERHGFVFVKIKIFAGDRHTAFYIHTLPDSVLAENKSSWNKMADSWFGVTALPTYGCLCPNEDELHLFPDLNGKKVLDIGCGSGHSLKWCGDHGSAELWGLDLSGRQLENAGKYLRDNNYKPKLFCSPMEQNPGLPQDYFDVVYSIYAIGWTMDLPGTFKLIASYLKSGGIFIFSWDHPFMHCVEAKDGQLMFSGSYYNAEPFSFQKGGNPVTLLNRRLSDYINALADAGFSVERVVEETDLAVLEREVEFSSDYYAPSKAKQFPLSLIVKAKKP